MHEDVVQRARFDHPAVMRDDNLLGHIGDHAEVVGNQQNRHAELALHVADQLQDLRLHGDVKRGGGLVGDQERRTADQRHRDHGALPEPARQLERIGVDRLLRAREIDELQHLDGARPLFLLAHLLVHRDRFTDLVADRVERREGGHRLLEDHADAVSPHVNEFLAAGRQFGEVEPSGDGIVEDDLAAGDMRRARQDSHDRLRRHRLAGAGLADQRHGAAVTHAHRQTVDRLHLPGQCAELHRKVANRQQLVRVNGRVERLHALMGP